MFIQQWNKAVMDICLRETKPSEEEFWRKTPSVTHIECLNISSVLGYHKTWSSLFAFNVTGISEGNESLITLMCGTHDDLDKSPESIVNNSCTVDHLS